MGPRFSFDGQSRGSTSFICSPRSPLWTGSSLGDHVSVSFGGMSVTVARPLVFCLAIFSTVAWLTRKSVITRSEVPQLSRFVGGYLPP